MPLNRFDIKLFFGMTKPSLFYALEIEEKKLLVCDFVCFGYA